jgi:hypothetical protein
MLHLLYKLTIVQLEIILLGGVDRQFQKEPIF